MDLQNELCGPLVRDAFLHIAHLWSLFSVDIKRIANLPEFGPLYAGLDKLIIDGLLHIQP